MNHLNIDSPLGTLTLAGDGTAIVGIWFEGHRYPPSAETLGERVEPGAEPVLDEAAAQLLDYLAGRRESFDVPLAPRGTEHQRLVWDALLRIPRGHATTYGELARQIGKPKAAQAVGQAVGHNPVSIVVPCHRVVGADGSMTGYAGGLERKRFLLDLEGFTTTPDAAPLF